MISFRYHLVTIIGIFLAIALGVVVGTSALNGAVVGDLRRQVSDLKKDQSGAANQNKSLAAQAGNADLLAQTFGSKIAGSALTNVAVVLVGAPGATKTMKDAVAAQIVASGGRVAGRIQLTNQFDDPAQANAIRSLTTSSSVHPIGLQLPATDDAGMLAGALLGYVLFGHGQNSDLTQVLAGFNTLNMATTEGPPVSAGKALVFVTQGSQAKADPATAMLLSFATEVGVIGGPTVLVGDPTAASEGGLIALARTNDGAKKSVSSVDNASTPLGQLTVALTVADAMAGRKGNYGTAAGADALLPGVSN